MRLAISFINSLVNSKWKKGQGLVEYGLIIVLIAIVVIVILNALGVEIIDLFNTVNSEMDGV